MEAVIVKQPGGVDQLSIGRVERPVPSATQLLVRIHACALNRMDISQREGRYPPPPGASTILGVEMAGVVEKCGAQVSAYKPGDRVFGLMGGGAYAEYCVIAADAAMPIPTDFTFEQAASLPEVWFTAYQALHLVAGLQAGQDVLLHAGASGVGTAAIQLAYIAGARNIIVTCGSQDKLEHCMALGATLGINYKSESFREKVADWTGGEGVHVIVDPVGAAYLQDNLASLAMDGRLVQLAFMSGTKVAEFDMAPILRKRLRIEGSTLRSRPLSYQVELRNRFYTEILPRLVAGDLQLSIDRVFSWREVADAHRYMESNQSRGKIVLKID